MITGILISMLAFVVRSTVAISLGLFAAYKTKFGRDRRIYKIDVPEGQLKNELLTILKIIPFYSFLVALAIEVELVKFGESTLIASIATFAFIFVWNETWFYFFHRLIHSPKFIKIHADHHRSRLTTPLTVSVFSFSEQTAHVVLALALPAIVSRFIPLSFAGVIAYSALMIVFNVLGHMNVEIYPGWVASSKFGKILSTPTYHAIHHARGKGHYGLLTSVPDRLFGTFYEDYPLVQARAARGEGLTSLGEKISVKSA